MKSKQFIKEIKKKGWKFIRQGKEAMKFMEKMI